VPRHVLFDACYRKASSFPSPDLCPTTKSQAHWPCTTALAIRGGDMERRFDSLPSAFHRSGFPECSPSNVGPFLEHHAVQTGFPDGNSPVSGLAVMVSWQSCNKRQFCISKYIWDFFLHSFAQAKIVVNSAFH